MPRFKYNLPIPVSPISKIKMKKLNLTKLLILCCFSLFCNPKTEKPQPIIYNNNNKINNQNYKFDDDEILKKNTKDSLKNAKSLQEEIKKRSAKKFDLKSPRPSSITTRIKTILHW